MGLEQRIFSGWVVVCKVFNALRAGKKQIFKSYSTANYCKSFVGGRSTQLNHRAETETAVSAYAHHTHSSENCVGFYLLYILFYSILFYFTRKQEDYENKLKSYVRMVQMCVFTEEAGFLGITTK